MVNRSRKSFGSLYADEEHKAGTDEEDGNEGQRTAQEIERSRNEQKYKRQEKEKDSLYRDPPSGVLVYFVPNIFIAAHGRYLYSNTAILGNTPCPQEKADDIKESPQTENEIIQNHNSRLL